MQKLIGVVLLFALFAILPMVFGSEPSSPAGKDASLPPLSEEDRAALVLGRKVLAVAAAIKHPDSPGAMKAITALGQDQRHYVLVRGWLAYQLQAERSLLEANEGRDQAKFEKRVTFLEKAIRLVDLE